MCVRVRVWGGSGKKSANSRGSYCFNHGTCLCAPVFFRRYFQVWRACLTDDGLDYYFNTETSETRLVKFVIYFSIVFEASFFSPSFFPPALIAAVLYATNIKTSSGWNLNTLTHTYAHTAHVHAHARTHSW